MTQIATTHLELSTSTFLSGDREMANKQVPKGGSTV